MYYTLSAERGGVTHPTYKLSAARDYVREEVGNVRHDYSHYTVFRARRELTRRDTSDPESKPKKLASFFKKYPGQNQAGQQACLKDAVFFHSSPRFVL